MIRILDKDIEYLFPTEERMEKWFKDFNARFFNNELEQPELCVGWLKIGTLGCFLHPKLGRFTRFNPAECTIILNGTYFMQAAEWENTFLHEMIHYYVFKEHGFEMKQGHGKEFKREAKRIGAMSDYSIDKRASLREVFFRPNQAMLNAWVRMERNEFVIGIIQKIRTEIFYDEETDISCPIDLTKYSSAFKTTDKFIPEIIENLSGQKFRVFWYSVNACCQKLQLLRPCTYSIPRGSDYVVPSVWGLRVLKGVSERRRWNCWVKHSSMDRRYPVIVQERRGPISGRNITRMLLGSRMRRLSGFWPGSAGKRTGSIPVTRLSPASMRLTVPTGSKWIFGACI